MGLIEKHNYLDKTKKCIINIPITVYDMKSGGYSILKKNGCFTKSEILFLNKKPKKELNKILGKMIKKNNWTEILMNGFIDARRKFCEYNNIEMDDILSIKKDALFIINKPVSNLKFNGYEFKLEAKYSSFYYLNDVEFYYDNNKSIIDVKGISNDNIDKHSEFFLEDLMNIFKVIEGGDKDYIASFLKQYRSLYLRKELDIGCYRELNLESLFSYKRRIGGFTYLIEDTDDIDSVDILYNYKNYIIPIINMVI